MRSGQRTTVDRETLRGVLAASGVAPGRLDSYDELAEGTFNSAYRLRLTDGADLVLKIAPDPRAPRMAYEQGLMRTEEIFYRAAHGRLPVPEVVHTDFGHGVVGGDFLLMTWCPGATLHALRGSLGADRLAAVRAELGGAVAALHRITGPGFGYPQAGLAPDWRTAFLGMADAVCADARRFGAALPVPVDRVEELVRGSADLLDDVTVPSLVHFDLWTGNILVDDAGGEPAVTGLVDGERAFWGDPLAEMVSLALFGDIAQDTAFLDGYRAAGGAVVLDARARGRLALYRCYLYLIMLVEAVPRGASGPEHERASRHVGRALVASLDALARRDS